MVIEDHISRRKNDEEWVASANGGSCFLTFLLLDLVTLLSSGEGSSQAKAFITLLLEVQDSRGALTETKTRGRNGDSNWSLGNKPGSHRSARPISNVSI